MFLSLCALGEGLCLTLAHEVSSLPHLRTHSWTSWPCHLFQSPQFETSCGFLEIFLPFIVPQQKAIDLMLECPCPPSLLKNGSSCEICCGSLSGYFRVRTLCKGRGCFFSFSTFCFHRNVSFSGVLNQVVAVLLSKYLFCTRSNAVAWMDTSCDLNLAWSLPVESNWSENISVKIRRTPLPPFSKLHSKAAIRNMQAAHKTLLLY